MSPASYISMIVLKHLIVTLLFCGAIGGEGRFIRICHVSQIIMYLQLH